MTVTETIRPAAEHRPRAGRVRIRDERGDRPERAGDDGPAQPISKVEGTPEGAALDGRVALRRRGTAFFDQALVSGTNFLTRLVVGYACASDQFGVLVLVFTLLFFWDGIRNAFLASPLVVFLPRRPASAVPPYAGDTIQMLIAVLTSGVVIFLIAAGLASLTGHALLAHGLLVGSFALTGWSAREHVRSLFFARLRVGTVLVVDALYAGLQLGALAGLWITGHFNVFNVLAVVGAAQLVAAGVGLILMRGQLVFRAGGLRRIAATHWRFGRWLLAGTLAFAVAAEFYPWIVNACHGLEAAAALGACQLPLFCARPIVQGLMNVFTPELSHHRAQNGILGFHHRVRGAQVFLLAPLLLFGGLIVLFSRDILDLMYDGKYVEYAPLLALLTIHFLAVALVTPLNQAFLVMDKPHYYFFVPALGAVFTMTVGLALTWRFGVLGAGAGLLAVDAGVGVVAFLLYRRVMKRADPGLSAGPEVG